MGEAVRMTRIFAGCAAATSAIMGGSIWMINDVEPMLKILGLTIAVGQAPLAAYLLAAIFEDSKENSGNGQ